MHRLKNVISKKSILILLVILVLALISGVSYETWKILNDKSKKTDLDSTAHWKTYQNEKYGYEVKYPQDWYFITEFGDSVVSFYRKSDTNKVGQQNEIYIMTDIRVTGLSKDMNLSNAVNVVGGSLPEQRYKVNNIDVIELREPGIYDTNDIYFQNKDGLLFHFGMIPADSSYRVILDTMMSTFKFTN